MAYGIGKPGHVATSLTIAERPRERAPARRSDKGGVASHRYFPRVGEGAAPRPRTAGIVPVGVAYLLSPDDVETDYRAPAPERASPYEAPLLGIGARLPRTGRAGLDFNALEIAPQHDVDRPANGVSAV